VKWRSHLVVDDDPLICRATHHCCRRRYDALAAGEPKKKKEWWLGSDKYDLGVVVSDADHRRHHVDAGDAHPRPDPHFIMITGRQ
jgi:hypothetical protein